ncbi:hypothetical protein V6N11_050144 [Hibiscus sabdariffa]|uniref:Uncharacterized protein n=1 Tax=Hibiscus sabdariffa TaxID=183260 RepID=A0ABR2T9L6_9ROSI
MDQNYDGEDACVDSILNDRFSALISSPSALYLEDLGCRFFLELKSIVLLSSAGNLFLDCLGFFHAFDDALF